MGDRIREARKHKGLTQEHLAESFSTLLPRAFSPKSFPVDIESRKR